ncbi:type VI secretion system-associated protein TagF [Rhizobium paknamense]|uniref:Type VI secretion system protein ImpM n=1 Tax=Rhizobium paknamense TaxID=1206817 RepID=A0ABU0IBF4_9HYPH|nr:type VI secretion system-associated protein TagF [Rhizobium paknamense]MDQ0454584.1 type VI secretion system protein ImpM [Rhizobium paknamense]
MAPRPQPSVKMTPIDRIGFFGKLPSHGDFISDGLERETIEALDRWCREGLHACEMAFGAGWEKLFAASPPWRFIVEKGIWGRAAFAGVLLPSHDRVGRSFPLIIAAQLNQFDYHPRTLYLDRNWFIAAEGLAESSITRDFDLGRFIDSLKRMRLPRPQEDEGLTPATPDRSGLWWYIDQETMKPRGLRLSAPLKAEHFLKLFREVSQSAEKPVPPQPEPTVQPAETPQPKAPLAVQPAPLKAPALGYSYATHAGTRFSINADGLFLSAAPPLFAVADGVGDHGSAEAAAKLAANSLATIGPVETAEDMLHEIKGKLGKANSLLLARPPGNGLPPPAASIVTASVVAGQILIVWAGDARAYLLRDGTMRPLTRDHVSLGLQKRLRRGLGLEPQFLPESLMEAAKPGDQLFLCSYPLIHLLGERAVAELLLDHAGDDPAEALIQEGLIANARENISAIVIRLSDSHVGGSP